VKEVLKFLTESPIFYFATVEGDKPRVRPFGFVMEYKGKLWFCTDSEKNVYKQLLENPYFEACTVATNKWIRLWPFKKKIRLQAPGDKWIRLRGKAVFNNTPEIKAKALESMPLLMRIMYSKNDSILRVFYVEDGEVDFCSMTGETKTVKL